MYSVAAPGRGRIVVPSDLTEPVALSLFVFDLPDTLNLREVDAIDFEGKDAHRVHLNEGWALACRIIAGRGYDSYHCTLEAAFCYDKGTKCARDLEFYAAALRSAGLAVERWITVGDTRNLRYARGRLIDMTRAVAQDPKYAQGVPEAVMAHRWLRRS